MAGPPRPTARGSGLPASESVGSDDESSAQNQEQTKVDPDPPRALRERWEEKTIAEKAQANRRQDDDPFGFEKKTASSTDTVVAEDSGEVLLDTGVGLDPSARLVDPEEAPTREDGRRKRGLANGTGETIDEPTIDRGQERASPPQPGLGAASPAVAPRSRRQAGASHAVLVVVSGSDRGRQFEIAGGLVTVGRAVDNDVILTDIAVSRRHLSIELDGDQYYVTDLGSGNGTILNDRDEEDRAALRHGDRLELGNTVIQFECPPPVVRALPRADPRPNPATTIPAAGGVGPGRRPQPVPAQPPAPAEFDDFDEEAATLAGRQPPRPPPGQPPLVGLPPEQQRLDRAPPSLPGAPLPVGPPLNLPPPRPLDSPGTPSAIRTLAGPALQPTPSYPLAPPGFGQMPSSTAMRPLSHQLNPLLSPAPPIDRRRLIIGISGVGSAVILIAAAALLFGRSGDDDGAPLESMSPAVKAIGEAVSEPAAPEPTEPRPAEDPPPAGAEPGGAEAPEAIATALVTGTREFRASQWGRDESDLSALPALTELEKALAELEERAREAQRAREAEKAAEPTSAREQNPPGGAAPSGAADARAERQRTIAAARTNASELYRRREFAQAAGAIRAAMREVSGNPAALRNLASDYERLGVVLNRASRAAESNPPAALRDFRQATTLDRKLGRAHQGFLRTRIQQLAARAAAHHMAEGNLEEARRAAADAEPRAVAHVYRSLESEAKKLLVQARVSVRRGEVQKARIQLKRIIDITAPDSGTRKEARELLKQVQ